jgi:predicted nucleic acid-binding Zn ribbon protein
MKCLNCNGPYEPKRDWQHFCADKCRKEFNRQRKIPRQLIESLIDERIKALIPKLVSGEWMEEVRELATRHGRAAARLAMKAKPNANRKKRPSGTG